MRRAKLRFRELFLGSLFLPDPYSLIESGDPDMKDLGDRALQFAERVRKFQRAAARWALGDPSKVKEFFEGEEGK